MSQQIQKCHQNVETTLRCHFNVMMTLLCHVCAGVNQPSHSWGTAISKFYLENSRWRSHNEWIQYLIDLHPFCSMSIGRPIPEIWLSQNLTLKIKGEGNEWGQTALRSQSGSGILSTHISFVPCQSALPFQIYLAISKFDLEHQSLKVIVQGHIVILTPCWLASF